MLGVGALALVIYIVSVICINTFLKRKISEAIVFSLLILLAYGGIVGRNVWELFKDGLLFALRQDSIFAALAFIYMAFLMSKTGIIDRLITILNSVVGRLRGGAGYVTTIASALFGLVSGSGSGNASSVGSITIPWMQQSGWSDETATVVIAGNAGLGILFPPSSSMFILLGMPAVAAEVSSGDFYVTMLTVGLIVLLYRLVLIRCYVGKYGIRAVDSSLISPIGEAFAANWTSLLIFLGVAIPLLLTTGPAAAGLKAAVGFGAKAVKSISILIWIPILITVITAIEGWKYLPHTVSGWLKMNLDAAPRYAINGILGLAAYTGSRILIKLGLEKEIASTLQSLGTLSPWIVVLVVALLINMMVGPFTGSATTAAVGSLAYVALRSVNVPPLTACAAILCFISNEGCIPPNSSPIYLASGISGIEDPSVTFKPLLLHYALPTAIIGVLIAMQILPVYQ